MLDDVVALVVISRLMIARLVRCPGGAAACLPGSTTDIGDPIDDEDRALLYLLLEVRCYLEELQDLSQVRCGGRTAMRCEKVVRIVLSDTPDWKNLPSANFWG